MVKRPSPLDVYKLLDKSNCKACGRNTCMEFVTDLLERRVKLEDCPEEHLKPKKRKKLYNLIKPPQSPLEFGVGERACIIGGEEAFNRHDLTFFNETALVIDVYDEMPDLMDVVKYVTEVKISRMGDELTLNGIAIRCTSNDPSKFAETVKKVAGATDLPLMLCSWNVEALIKAAEGIKNKKPLLYAATKENWKELGGCAVQNNFPVVCFSKDLNELVSIAQSLEKMGVKDICLDPGTTIGEGLNTMMVDKIQKIRYSSIRDGSNLTNYPVIGVASTVWASEKPKNDEDIFALQYKEALAAVLMMSLDTNLIVLHTGRYKEEIWLPLDLMTFRQNIFTDPRIYPRVDPGLFEIGNPTEESPLFMTSNYRMTKIPVEQDIADAHIDGWLLVVDTDGLGIEAGVAGGQLSPDKVADALNETKAFEKVNHRILVTPGYAARLQGAIEDGANCIVVVGPGDSSGIQKFMENDWKPKEFMATYNERIS
ncbi:MAG: acetyl-CoA decarbonylase/synthase complex subunit gamma [archaeon]|nr:acetyl-CoA decarbonylase/synthase complex subunit gamma [archaeon]